MTAGKFDFDHRVGRTLADRSSSGRRRQGQRNECRLGWTDRSPFGLQKLSPPAKQQAGMNTMMPGYRRNRRSSNFRLSDNRALLLS